MGGTVQVPATELILSPTAPPYIFPSHPPLVHQLFPPSCPPPLWNKAQKMRHQRKDAPVLQVKQQKTEIIRNLLPILEPESQAQNSFLYYIVSQQLFLFPIIKLSWINIAKVIKYIKMCWHHSWWVRIHYQTLKIAQSFAMEGACKCYVTVIVCILLPNMAPCL